MPELFLTRSEWIEVSWRAPPTGVLAIGDPHGHDRHCTALLAAAAAEVGDVVFLGDYLHRGPGSLAILKSLPMLPARFDIRLHLVRGNHDVFLIELLERGALDAASARRWLARGAGDLLREAGLPRGLLGRDPAAAAAGLVAHLGDAACALITGAAFAVRLEDWLFVHAGIAPTEPLAEQSPEDWLALREPFLGARKWTHPFGVVHGHTPRRPCILAHRIGIDSGCYRTGVLTAVELVGRRARFHLVATADNLLALAALPGSERLPPLAPLRPLTDEPAEDRPLAAANG